MIKLAKNTTQRLLDIHGWSGVILGLALYVVVFTGSIVVFVHEIGVWSANPSSIETSLSTPLDAKIMTLINSVPEAYRDEFEIRQDAANQLIIRFHTHEKVAGEMKEKVIRYQLNPKTLAVLQKFSGYRDEIPAINANILESFFAELHINLHAPDPIGLYLTGMIGLILLISAISGLILHRHLIKDIFLSPRLSTRLLNTRDRHNLAGTWSIPFSIILAFTGAFFSFATTLGLPVIAITAFGGDQQKAMQVIIPEQQHNDPTPAVFLGVENIIKQTETANIAGSLPLSIDVTHWGRADALVTTTHAPTAANMFFSRHQFNGVTGEYLGEKPTLGKVASTGSNMFGLMQALHFGWFAGLLSKVIWMSLGLATCYVTLTGLQLWVRRRANNHSWRPYAALISIVGYGTPIAMITAAIGYLAAAATNVHLMQSWTINGFLIGVALSFLLGWLAQKQTAGQRLFLLVTGCGLLLLPLMHTLTSASHLATSHLTTISVNLTFLIGGIVFLVLSMRHRPLTFTKEAGAEQENHA